MKELTEKEFQNTKTSEMSFLVLQKMKDLKVSTKESHSV